MTNDITRTEEELDQEHFRRGQLVRFLGGPVMCTLTSPDEDGDVYCMWWNIDGTLDFADFPASVLIHISPETATRPPMAASERTRSMNLNLRWCSLFLGKLFGPGGKLGVPRSLQKHDLPTRGPV